jgi:hypothetical protein
LASTSQKVAEPVQAHRHVALGAGSVWLSLEQALYDGLGGLEVAEGFGKCGVIKCVIALGDKEPELRVKAIGPIRLHGENLGKETGGLGGLVTISLELSALKKGEKIGAVLLVVGNGACLHLLQDAGAFCGGVCEGMIHTFLGEDASHFIEDLCGPAGALDLGEGSGQFIDTGKASGTSLLGSLTEALTFLSPLGLFRLGEGGLVGALDGFEEVYADLLCRDREAFENLLLPGLEGPALLGELIAEERDLQLEFVVVGGVVVNMAVVRRLSR